MTNCQSMNQTPPPLPCRRWAINSPLTMTRSRIHQWSLSRAKKNNNWRFWVMALKQEVKDPPQSPSHRIRADYRSMTSVDFLFEHMIGVTVYTWIPGGLCRWFMKQCTNVVFFQSLTHTNTSTPPQKNTWNPQFWNYLTHMNRGQHGITSEIPHIRIFPPQKNSRIVKEDLEVEQLYMGVS